MPATAEDGVDITLPESEETQFQAALVEQAHNSSEAHVPLRITGEQTIRNADQLHKAFTVYLDRGQAIVVDLSEVDECDTAALQLIYALRQSAVQRKQRFHITAVSPAITETATELGLLEELMTPCGPGAADIDCAVADSKNGI